MSDEWRSTDEKESELERTSTFKRISDQTSSEQGKYSGITATKSDSDHSSRKRRTVRQRSDEDIGTCEKKRNYDLEAANVLRSLALQTQETTFETEKQQNLKQNQTSPRPGRSNTSSESSELVHSQKEQQEETKRATCQTKDIAIAEIKSSPSSEIATTSKQSNPVENLIQSLLKYPDLFQKDEDGDTILHLAIVHKNINLTLATILAMVRRKHENDKVKGIDIQNELRQTPLHLAVLTCQPSIVEYLILHGTDVNAIDRNGQTALHLACKNADVEDIQALRKITPKDSEKSIIVDLKNFEGLAPIHLATLSGSCEVIEQLLDMDADIDLKDSKSGRTALHHAVEAHNPIVTRFLLLKDANVNAQTFAGNTPLHTASGRRMEHIIRILLEFGADRKLTNFEGDLPIPETYMPYSMIRKIAQKSKEKK